MRLVRSMLIGAALVGMVVVLSGVSFAQEAQSAGKDSSAWQAKREARIKLLQDSAAALQQSNPDLAKGLLEMAEGHKGGKETKEAKDSAEWKAKREARVKVLKDSAAALQQSNPDLAKSLLEMSERKPGPEHSDNKQ